MNKTKSMVQLAKEAGLPYSTYRYRVLNNIPLDAPTIELLEYKGKKKSVVDWAAHFNVDRKTMYDAIDYRCRRLKMTKKEALADIHKAW